jgi:hypothetical protein
MKKILLALSIGFTSIAAFSSLVYAQNSENYISSNDKVKYMPSIQNLTKLESPDLTDVHILNRNEVNISATRDFLVRFDNVKNALWFADPKGGFEAYFIQNGYGDRVVYGKKGGWQLSLLNYDEDKLPQDIRNEVKSSYSDMDITLVEEVQTYEGVEYIVYLQDNSNIKIIKINKDGIMEDLKVMAKHSY